MGGFAAVQVFCNLFLHKKRLIECLKSNIERTTNMNEEITSNVESTIRKVLISERDPVTAEAMGLAFQRNGFIPTFTDRIPLTRDGLLGYDAVCVGLVLPPVLGATSRASIPLLVATTYTPMLERQSMGAEALSGSLQFQRVSASLATSLARTLLTNVTVTAPPSAAQAANAGLPPTEPINRTPEQQRELVSNVLGQDDIPF